MKGNTVKKIKAFYRKHEVAIKMGAYMLIPITLYVAMKTYTDKIESDDTSDDLNEEEWEHLIDMARQMDEYVAERKALKTK